MSYEVYIDVEHHDKHFQGDEGKKESWCVRWADDPQDRADELVAVCNALRDMADEIDPRYVCENCGKTRGEHDRDGGLYRCFNRLGPITQSRWWRSPNVPRKAG